VSYATPDHLDGWADLYGVQVPHGQAERLLELATRDVQRHLGAEWDTDDLEPEQVAALCDGTCAQACFRIGQGGSHALGLDDGLASIGGVQFSMRTPPRFSPEAAELLAGLGLYVRTGTVPLAVDDEPT
jgi:hypothetical protein